MAEQQTAWQRIGTGILTIVLGTSLLASAAALVAARDLGLATSLRLGQLERDVERNRQDLEGFKSPGGRFTAVDGAEHRTRLERLEAAQAKSIETLSQLKYRADATDKVTDNLCNRIRQCVPGGGR